MISQANKIFLWKGFSASNSSMAVLFALKSSPLNPQIWWISYQPCFLGPYCKLGNLVICARIYGFLPCTWAINLGKKLGPHYLQHGPWTQFVQGIDLPADLSNHLSTTTTLTFNNKVSSGLYALYLNTSKTLPFSSRLAPWHGEGSSTIRRPTSAFNCTSPMCSWNIIICQALSLIS